MDWSFSSLVVWVLLIVLLIQLGKLRERVKALEHQLDSLHGWPGHTPSTPAGLPTSSPPIPPRVVPPAPVVQPAATVAPPPVRAQAPPPPMPPIPVPPSIPAPVPERPAFVFTPPPTPRPMSVPPVHIYTAPAAAISTPPPHTEPAHTPAPRTRPEWEVLIGGNVFNIIGAIALILAIVYLLKLAFDNNWIIPQVRVLAGFLFGVGLIVAGDRARKRHLDIFATGLIGAGIASLYIAAYATYGFHFRLVSAPIAFALMSAVTVVTLVLAVRFDLLTVTFLGWFGGFVTPLLLSDAGGSLVSLFAYLALLTTGLLLLTALRERWAVLEPLTLLATYGLFFVAIYRAPGDTTLPMVFLLLYWALFTGAEMRHALRGNPTRPALRYLHAVLNLCIAALGVYCLPVPHAWLAPISLGAGAVYLLPLPWLVKQSRTGAVTQRFALFGVVLLGTAIFFQCSAPWAIIAWALLALALVWLGLTTELPYFWLLGLLLFGVGVLRLFLMPEALAAEDAVHFIPVLHLRFLVYTVLCGALTGATALFSRHTEGELREVLRGLLHFAVVGVAFTLLTVETNDLFRHLLGVGATPSLISLAQARALTLGGCWFFFGLPMVWFGCARRRHVLYWLGLAIALLGAGTVAIYGWQYEVVTHYLPLYNLRTLLFVLVTAGGLWLARRLVTQRDMMPAAAGTALAIRILAVLLVMELITAETSDLFNHLVQVGVTNAFITLAQAGTLILGGLWFAYGLVVTRFGFRPHLRVLYWMGLAIAFLGVDTLAIFGWHYATVAHYLPLLNLRALLLVGAAVGAVRLARQLAVQEELPDQANTALVLRIVAVLLVWEVVTVECLDFFTYQVTGPAFLRMAAAPAQALLLAGAWTLLAGGLLWRGLRRNVGYQWLAGLILLTMAIVLACTGGTLVYTPIAGFLPLLNLRAVVLALIVIAAGMSLRAAEERRPTLAVYLRLVWMGVTLFGLSLDANDTISRLLDAFGPQALHLDAGLARGFALAVTGGTFGVILLARGLWAPQRALRIGGLAALAASAVLAAESGLSYLPLDAYVPVLNPRVAGMVAVVLLCAAAATLLHRKRDAFSAAPLLTQVAQWVCALLLFEVVTTEILDFFNQRFSVEGVMNTQANLGQFMLLAAFWTAYSLPLVWYGLRKRLTLVLGTGLVMLALGIVAVAVKGYTDAAGLSLLGVRALAMLFVIIALLVQEQWLLREQEEFTWTTLLAPLIQIVAGVLLFELVSVETRDLFQQATSGLLADGADAAQHRLHILANMRQLAISLGWLLYSIGVMAYGLWRRLFHLRVIAFLVFGIVIVKVFFFDLAFLDTLYRCCSFLGLAVILFAVSYLFQRYRTALIGAQEPDAVPEPMLPKE